jgi:uncharacterized protein (TIGR02466 family)
MIKNIFTTAIYQTELNFDVNLLTDRVYKIYEENKNVKSDWYCDTWNSLLNHNLIEDKHFNNLLYEISNNVKIFSKEYQIDETKKLACSAAWVNISKQNNFQEFHNHANSHFSVVFYIKTKKNCGNIIFKNTEAFFDMFTLPIQKDSYNTLNCKTYSVEPKDNMLLIFRSNLQHMVEKNISNSDRISLSANFKILNN